jgi:hypothetical protein
MVCYSCYKCDDLGVRVLSASAIAFFDAGHRGRLPASSCLITCRV